MMMEQNLKKGGMLSPTAENKRLLITRRLIVRWWEYISSMSIFYFVVCLQVMGIMGLRHLLSQPHFGQVCGWSPTLGNLGFWSPPRLPNVQSSTARGKTPRIGVFLVSLERSWNVDIENALALTIRTSAAQVMGKRSVGSQTGSFTPDH
jgi:hypothetical protein